VRAGAPRIIADAGARRAHGAHRAHRDSNGCHVDEELDATRNGIQCGTQRSIP
jgi:hypothetical protein